MSKFDSLEKRIEELEDQVNVLFSWCLKHDVEQVKELQKRVNDLEGLRAKEAIPEATEAVRQGHVGIISPTLEALFAAKDKAKAEAKPADSSEGKIQLHVLQEIRHDNVEDGDAVVITGYAPPIYVKLPERELEIAEPVATDGKTADEKAEKPEPVAKDRNDNRLKAGDILAYTDADGIDFKRLIAIADENNKITTSRLDCRGCTIGVDAKDYVLWQRAEGN